MTNNDYLVAAELSLGSSRKIAMAQGTRTFSSVANALRFAVEEAAPVSLRGARLFVGDRVLARTDMIAMYRSRRYPLIRKSVILESY